MGELSNINTLLRSLFNIEDELNEGSEAEDYQLIFGQIFTSLGYSSLGSISSFCTRVGYQQQASEDSNGVDDFKSMLLWVLQELNIINQVANKDQASDRANIRLQRDAEELEGLKTLKRMLIHKKEKNRRILSNLKDAIASMEPGVQFAGCSEARGTIEEEEFEKKREEVRGLLANVKGLEREISMALETD